MSDQLRKKFEREAVSILRKEGGFNRRAKKKLDDLLEKTIEEKKK